MADCGSRLRCFVGMVITEEMRAAILEVPASGWTSAYDGDGRARLEARVADITELLELGGGHARHRPQGAHALRRAAAVTETCQRAVAGTAE